MKPRKTTTHEAPELMHEFGADTLEEKEVYGARPEEQKESPAHPGGEEPTTPTVKEERLAAKGSQAGAR